MAAALIELGRLRDVSRPAIAVTSPTTRGFCVVLDAGANADCKPVNLLEFGHMGSIFAQHVLNIPNPKVGLLSIGEESTKGNEVTIEANKLLAASSLNFIGNVEGRDILRHTADVVVCDGFVGNIILKFEESILHVLKAYIKENLKGWRFNLGALLLKPMVKKFAKDYDPEEYGGEPLLGINGNVIISHGSSSAVALCNAVRVAGRMSILHVNEIIEKNLERK
jgi:phosphate acyltransferase